MEGLGYWVFLLLLYGLSALLKKRRRTEIRNRPDPERKHEPPPRFTSKEDILKELFGGSLTEELKPVPVHQQEPEYMDGEPLYDEEPEYGVPEKAGNVERYDSSAFEPPERKTVFYETTPDKRSLDSIIEPTVDTVHIPANKRGMTSNVTRITARKHANLMLVAMLKNKHALKYSFMLREVLDKPRAMRRHIR